MTACTLSCPADGLSWLDALAPHAPDAFVTPALPGVAASGAVGLWPMSEWRMGRDGGLAELKRFCFESPGPALGFLSYHAGFEGLGVTLPAPAFPPGVFRKYRAVLSPGPDARSVTVRARDEAAGREALRLVAAPAAPPWADPAPGTVRASLGREGYVQTVRQALGFILDGHVYQLNLSVRFETPWPPGRDPARLFTRLLAEKPALFYALYHDSPYTIVSTSPERFIRVRGGRVLSQPIKGTRPAGNDRSAALRELLGSAKEDAELSMVVDLIRNDISAHCRHGSVGVEGHRSVFEVDGLLQMYSNVTGELAPGSTALDLLWEALPPGSVTGCPKARAVEIISALEPHHREAYCGCLAMVHGPRDLDSSVVIRAAVADASSGTLCFHAGSGIVVDSDPESEYEEALAKASKFLALTRREAR